MRDTRAAHVGAEDQLLLRIFALMWGLGCLCVRTRINTCLVDTSPLVDRSHGRGEVSSTFSGRATKFINFRAGELPAIQPQSLPGRTLNRKLWAYPISVSKFCPGVAAALKSICSGQDDRMVYGNSPDL